MTYIERPEPGVTKITGGFDEPTSLRAWPVNSIFLSMSSDSPETLLGGGTWVRLAQGRVLMGYDPSGGEFGNIGALAGVKNTTLTTANLPPHHHEAGTLVTDTGGAHDHSVDRREAVGAAGGVARGNTVSAPADTVGTNGSHNHDVIGNTADAGEGTSFTNLPPYIVVAMWRRTA